VFLRSLEAGCTVDEAAKSANAGRRTVYRWRENDEKFAKAWDRALDRGTSVLEDIALERAKEKSDTLLIFLLKSRRPDVYAERKVIAGEVNHKHSGQIGISQTSDWIADTLGGGEERAPSEPVH
jgi:hypothetical protein